MNLAHATPRNELSSTGYCLTEPGVTYLVFAAEGGDIEVDLTAGDGPFAVEWLSAATDEVARVTSVSGGGKQTLRAPFDGAAVLFLKKTP